MYYKKKSDHSLLITSYDQDSPVISLTGDFMTVWEVIDNDSHKFSSPLIDPINDTELLHLKPFFTYLVGLSIKVKIDQHIKNILLSKVPKVLKGTYINVPMGEPHLPTVWASCSFNGTDAFFNPECSTNGPIE